MSIETPKQFAKVIETHMNRMEMGFRMRMAAGELPGYVTCECGISLEGKYQAYHRTVSPLHIGPDRIV